MFTWCDLLTVQYLIFTEKFITSNATLFINNFDYCCYLRRMNISRKIECKIIILLNLLVFIVTLSYRHFFIYYITIDKLLLFDLIIWMVKFVAKAFEQIYIIKSWDSTIWIANGLHLCKFDIEDIFHLLFAYI